MMIQELPKKLLVGVAIVGVLLFAASFWLEAEYLAVLQNHPIMVNLMSGLVAFCFGVLTIGAGFNWLVAMQERRRNIALVEHVMSDPLNAILQLPVSVSGISPSLRAMMETIPVTDVWAILRQGDQFTYVDPEAGDRYEIGSWLQLIVTWLDHGTPQDAAARLNGHSVRMNNAVAHLRRAVGDMQRVLEDLRSPVLDEERIVELRSLNHHLLVWLEQVFLALIANRDEMPPTHWQQLQYRRKLFKMFGMGGAHNEKMSQPRRTRARRRASPG
jgi:hypothetical protein